MPVARQDAVVDGVLDQQRCGHRAHLPEQAGQGGADDAAPLGAYDGEHESPRGAPSRVVVPHGSKYPVMSNTRAPVEERFARPSVMGVVNVTPDSFSDGGVHLEPSAAIAAAKRMVEDGARIVDVGGESTRPGSTGLSAEDE